MKKGTELNICKELRTWCGVEKYCNKDQEDNREQGSFSSLFTGGSIRPSLPYTELMSF